MDDNQREEKELKAIKNEFSKGVEAFKKQECRQAVETFDRIVDLYKDSEFHSVLGIQTRARAYGKICQSRANPQKVALEEDEDYLFDGIYQMNAGDLDTSLERFRYLDEKKYGDPYLQYLLALLYLKRADSENCLKYLQAAVEADQMYKVIAHNEPDFDPMFENEEFVSLIGLDA
jgi:tetratricopeptide (TPR) repeat protein